MDLLETLLGAPDRDHCPGAAPVVSVSGLEDAEFLGALERRARTRVALSRRGQFHGEYAVLAPAGPEPSLERDRARWMAARPILLPGVARALLADAREEIALADRLHFELSEPGSLRPFVEQRLAGSGESFELSPRSQPLDDPERDLERVFLVSPAPSPR